ncbi:MAG: hypothetical protein Q4B22_11880, partial [Eubacteriales bacterium]|nr:hypothetical protein [Eubacteriales bacterium]
VVLHHVQKEVVLHHVWKKLYRSMCIEGKCTEAYEFEDAAQQRKQVGRSWDPDLSEEKMCPT